MVASLPKGGLLLQTVTDRGLVLALDLGLGQGPGLGQRVGLGAGQAQGVDPGLVPSLAQSQGQGRGVALAQGAALGRGQVADHAVAQDLVHVLEVDLARVLDQGVDQEAEVASRRAGRHPQKFESPCQEVTMNLGKGLAPGVNSQVYLRLEYFVQVF